VSAERTWVGLDVHARSVVGCAIDDEARENPFGRRATVLHQPGRQTKRRTPWSHLPGARTCRCSTASSLHRSILRLVCGR
jgi:hypothetical protein